METEERDTADVATTREFTSKSTSVISIDCEPKKIDTKEKE